MTFGNMSQTRVRAWAMAVIWVLAGAGFFLAFFSGGGADEFDTDSRRHLWVRWPSASGSSGSGQRSGSPGPGAERWWLMKGISRLWPGQGRPR